MTRTAIKKSNKTLLRITEECFIILIAILVLLAIAIGAAGAKTLFTPKTEISQPFSASMADNDNE